MVVTFLNLHSRHYCQHSWQLSVALLVKQKLVIYSLREK